jgi:glucosylceramidase
VEITNIMLLPLLYTLSIVTLAAASARAACVHYVSLAPGTIIGPSPVKVHDAPSANLVSDDAVSVLIDPTRKEQELDGIGGAFNEIGAEAFSHLSALDRLALLKHLFHPEEGAGFSYCRTAVGASDFAFEAYSYSEVPEDFEQKHFSIARDQQHLLPLLRAAREMNPSLKLFASPWSPPGWMKQSGAMDRGTAHPEENRLKRDPTIHAAYAKYLTLYIQAYGEQGVPIDRLLVQNETDMTTKYPSCWMEPTEMVEFIRQYLAPAFRKQAVGTEIWAGTFRTVKLNHALDFVQAQGARENVSGVGFQYAKPDPVAGGGAPPPHPPVKIKPTAWGTRVY